ncbi:MAG: hypothetical protein RL220_1115, partial [Bacteroidota bacterium]
ACAADKIYANPNTITGSIGVFGVLPNFQKFLDNKIGITFDRYETNPHADMLSGVKPLDGKELEVMQTMVNDIYESFIGKVAEGRKLEVNWVDSIGQGRVWSGEDAIGLGLVDELGDLQDAIAHAASAAGINDYTVKELPAMIDPFQEIINDLTGSKSSISKALAEEGIPVDKLLEIKNMKGIQARMPFTIEFE